MCRIHLSALFLAMLLCACEESRPTVERVQEPAGADAPASKSAVMMPDVPDSELQDEVSRPTLKKQELRRLDLTLDHAPPEERSATGFAPASEPRWLKRKSAAAVPGAAADSSGLLPDLFDEHAGEKPVSVKGRLLIDEAGGDAYGPVDGAGLSIEIKTD